MLFFTRVSQSFDCHLALSGVVVVLDILCYLLDGDVIRPSCIETTALGAAYLAGLATGFWKNAEEIEMNRHIERTFSPSIGTERRESLLKGWHKAVKRVMNWEKD